MDLTEEDVAKFLGKRGSSAPVTLVTPATSRVVIEIGKHTILDGELAMIEAALALTEGNKGRACEILDITRPTLQRKLALIEKRKAGAA